MKIILEEKKEDTILINEINPKKHIVVCASSAHAYILTKSEYDDGIYSFRVFNQEFTEGNRGLSNSDICKLIREKLCLENRIEAFHQKDWKKALKWLIDNA